MSKPTLATRENMRAIENAHPSRRVEGTRAIAYSPHTGEQYSASPGDYFNTPDTEPLRDELGEPMVLVFKRTVYVDAQTGEEH